jgi:glycosyltransferase involved in cell wall biosynthesis
VSVCAILLVKDEDDIIEYTLGHLLGQVDHVIVSDNGSTDRTSEIVRDVALAAGGRVTLFDDPVVGYYQDEKTTALALLALAEGYSWVLPCDADEYWYAPDGRPIRDYVAGLAPDVQIVTADMYHHLPTSKDAGEQCEACGSTGSLPGSITTDPIPCPICEGRVEANPFVRIGWRKRERGTLPKVMCRTRPDLRIGMGNHSAQTDGTALTSPGLVIRHYSWRSAEQYVRKIRNGEAAYAAAPERAEYGAHWRAFEGKPDEAIVGHYLEWFWSGNPAADDSLIYDPAPGAVAATPRAKSPLEELS